MNLTVYCDSPEIVISKLDCGESAVSILQNLSNLKDAAKVHYIEDESGLLFIAVCNGRTWDTDFFGINISDLHPFWLHWDKLSIDSVSECIKAAMMSEFAGGADGIFCRLHSREIEMLCAFEKAGFRTYDIGCRFETTIDRLPKNNQKQKYLVREVHDSEIDYLVRMAEESFTHDRFHSDPRISLSKADAMHGEWIRNLSKDENVKMLVSLDQDEIAGFLTLRRLAEANAIVKNYVIDLIAVGSSHRRKSHGRNLINSLRNYIESDSRILVGTQITNSQAMKLYASNGFIPKSFYVTLHAWIDEFDNL